MKRLLQLSLASLLTVFTLSVASPAVAPAGAIDVFKDACGGGGGTGNSAGSGLAGSGGNSSSGNSAICGASKQDDVQAILKTVINTILLILGMIAVLMIIIGGIRYTTSNGDASQIKAAKDTILYAVVGLVVAILSYAIVNFVLGRFSGSGS